MKKDVKLITFHASHNFGSVMQAYALKHAVEGLGNKCMVVNFRPVAQMDKYSALPRQYGVKAMLRGAANYCGQPYGWKRTYDSYEEFIYNNITSNPTINKMADLPPIEADILLTGSDQVWGYQIPEFVCSMEDVRPAYYYSFASGRKVSYAASTGTATREQIEPYVKYLRLYDRISVREQASVGLISSIVPEKKVVCVLDPTFLLPAHEYRELLERTPDLPIPRERYCLLYSLQGLSARKNWLSLAGCVQDMLGLKVFSVSHFLPLRGPGVSPVTDIGPLNVLALFANASYVLTDTYHGTLFATHFGKQFVTFMPGREDPRISDVTRRLGLRERIAQSVDEGANLLRQPVDYEKLETIRSLETMKSLLFLRESLGE